jgi:hypothetical protein
MFAPTAAERLAILQAEQMARDQEMESLKAVAKAAKKAEEEQLATEKKAAKEVDRKRNAAEAVLMDEVERSEALPKKKNKGKAKAVEEVVEVVETLTDAAITPCQR